MSSPNPRAEIPRRPAAVEDEPAKRQVTERKFSYDTHDGLTQHWHTGHAASRGSRVKLSQENGDDEDIHPRSSDKSAADTHRPSVRAGEFEYLELAMTGEYWADSLGDRGRGELMGQTSHYTPAKRLQELGSEGWELQHVFADNLDFRFYIFRRPRLI